MRLSYLFLASISIYPVEPVFRFDGEANSSGDIEILSTPNPCYYDIHHVWQIPGQQKEPNSSMWILPGVLEALQNCNICRNVIVLFERIWTEKHTVHKTRTKTNVTWSRWGRAEKSIFLQEASGAQRYDAPLGWTVPDVLECILIDFQILSTFLSRLINFFDK